MKSSSDDLNLTSTIYDNVSEGIDLEYIVTKKVLRNKLFYVLIIHRNHYYKIHG